MLTFSCQVEKSAIKLDWQGQMLLMSHFHALLDVKACSPLSNRVGANACPACAGLWPLDACLPYAPGASSDNQLPACLR
jgi:hypothetical protein